MPKKYERDPKSGSVLLIGQMVVRPLEGDIGLDRLSSFLGNVNIVTSLLPLTTCAQKK